MISTQTRKNDLIINLVTRKYNVPAYAQRQYLSSALVNKDERPAYIITVLKQKYETDIQAGVFGLMDELLAGKTINIQSPESVWGLDAIHKGWIKMVGNDKFEWYVERTYWAGDTPHETMANVTDAEGAYKILSTGAFYLCTFTVKES